MGDVLGGAAHAPGRGNEPGVLSLHVYFGASIPAAIQSWFEEAFPSARATQPPGA